MLSLSLPLELCPSNKQKKFFFQLGCSIDIKDTQWVTLVCLDIWADPGGAWPVVWLGLTHIPALCYIQLLLTLSMWHSHTPRLLASSEGFLGTPQLLPRSCVTPLFLLSESPLQSAQLSTTGLRAHPKPAETH